MAADLEIEIIRYYAPGVTSITSSFSFFLGLLDGTTVLKYPHSANPDVDTQARLAVETQLYTILGAHPRIIEFKGRDARGGLRLEYAVNSSVAQYLAQTSNDGVIAAPMIPQRLEWARQAAEGMAHIHGRGVLHCDTNCNNLLLDGDLDVKFADFQGRCVAPDGTVILNGHSSENVKSFMLRDDPGCADRKTDSFALGAAMYYMMTGHEPFPELDPFDDGDEAEIVARCWRGEYGTAEEVADGFQEVIKANNGV